MRFAILLAVATAMFRGMPAFSDQPAPRPNIVLVFADDLGYGDIGCYGAQGYHTPNLDRLAKEGVRFTDFYVAQAVCSASRAALLTGCYSNRVGILGALGPKDRHGINDQEVTLAELLKSCGYATAIYGKWHLGHHPQFLPTRHGFDEYFGLPYSNDMWPKHPETKAFPDLPLIDGQTITELNPDQSQLTTWYAEHAVNFIERHRDQPFFVYLAHNMPHVPLFVSDKFRDKTARGLFGDVVEEIDWSVGQILKTLERLGLDERTLVLFTSDNGPWLSYGDHAGSAGPLREGKGTTFDGGVREPCLMRWPGKIPAGTVCREPAMTIDLLPTLGKLAGAKLPGEHRIDGSDIWPLISGEPEAKSPHDALFFYWGGELQALRSGRWKLHLPHAYRSLAGGGGRGGLPSKYQQRHIALSLFDLDADPGESQDVASEHPEEVSRLMSLAERAREDLGDTATRRMGTNVRPAGQLQDDVQEAELLDVLVIAPHPDDEAIGCGGVMLRAIKEGRRVGVVLLTGGDGYPMAAAAAAKKAEPQLAPADFLRLAAVRHQHSVGALTGIGVRAADLISLGYPDSGLKTIYEARDETPYRQSFTEKAETYGTVIRDYHTLTHGRPAPYIRSSVLADLVEIIKARRPQEIYVTDEADTHADHRTAFRFVRDAAKAAGYRGRLFSFVVHGTPPDAPDRRVVLTDIERVRKRALIEQYQTHVSPVHDDLAEQYACPEELFRLVPLRSNEP